MASDYQEIQDA